MHWWNNITNIIWTSFFGVAQDWRDSGTKKIAPGHNLQKYNSKSKREKNQRDMKKFWVVLAIGQVFGKLIDPIYLNTTNQRWVCFHEKIKYNKYQIFFNWPVKVTFKVTSNDLNVINLNENIYNTMYQYHNFNILWFLTPTLSAWPLRSHWALKSILWETLFLDQLHDFSLLSSNSFLQPFLKSMFTWKNSLAPKKSDADSVGVITSKAQPELLNKADLRISSRKFSL